MAREMSHPDQLDLFVHGGGTLLANAAIDALEQWDAVRAADCLHRLGATEPDYRSLRALWALCRAEEWPPPSADAAQIAAAVARLELETEPAARSVMPKRATSFMRPFWRDLAEAARGQPYDARWPQSFGAALYLRCGADAAAAETANAIPDRDDNPDALHWLAVARYRMAGTRVCLRSLMRLALLAPKRLPATLAEIGDTLLQRERVDFQDACLWVDADDENAGAWFPAWYLLAHPEFAMEVDSIPLPETPTARAFALLARLIELEKQGYSSALVTTRGQLRDLQAGLFALYMARRETGWRP
jgi:hypothetical protein